MAEQAIGGGSGHWRESSGLSGEVARERVRKYGLPYVLSIGQSKIFHDENTEYGAISGAIAVCGANVGAGTNACANGRGHVS